jgi:lipopolysaccharide export system permease protein
MFILARYVIREHIGPFFFAFALITSMLVLNFVLQAMRYIIGKGITLQVIAEYLIYNLAGIIVLVIPMSILVATIMAFGRLASDNEITAIKAGGINFYKLILPVIVVSAAVTYGLFVFNDKILPIANHHARVLKKNIQSKRPTLSIQPGVFLEDIDNFSMIVDNKDELSSAIYGVTIFDKSQRDLMRTITAEKGNLEIDQINEDMVLSLENGEIHERNPRKSENYQKIIFTKFKVIVPVGNLNLKKSDETFHNDREKNIEQLMEDVQRHHSEENKQLNLAMTAIQKNPYVVSSLDEKSRNLIRGYILDRSMTDRINNQFMEWNLSRIRDSTIIRSGIRLDAMGAALVKCVFREPVRISMPRDSLFFLAQAMSGAAAGKMDSSKFADFKPDTSRQAIAVTAQQITTNMVSASNYQRLMDQIMVEVNKKYSIPFACIVFVLLGAPIGVKARKGNLGIAGGISLFFFIAYYFCLILGEDYADRQLLNPFFAMWFMNILLGLVGIVLTYQTASETDFGTAAALRFLFDKMVDGPRRIYRAAVHRMPRKD